MGKVAWIALAGAGGSVARYLVQVWSVRVLGPAFPYGTLFVNAIGSFFICALMGLTEDSLSPELKTILTAGLLGGFTTYSAFNYEAFRYWQLGAVGLAVGYAALTVALCFGAGVAGDAAARALGR